MSEPALTQHAYLFVVMNLELIGILEALDLCNIRVHLEVMGGVVKGSEELEEGGQSGRSGFGGVKRLCGAEEDSGVTFGGEIGVLEELEDFIGDKGGGT